MTPEEIAARLTKAQRRAVMYREGASEACMGWGTARVLRSLGIMPRETRYQRLTPLGLSVRRVLEQESAK